MKKLMALLTAALLLCGAAMADELTGTWYGTLYGVPVTMEVNGDGTAGIEVMGQHYDNTWTAEGTTFTLKDSSSEMLFTLQDGQLVEEDDVMTFGREPVDGFTAPAAVTASAITDFDGTYTAEWVGVEGMYLDFDSFVSQVGEMLSITEPTITVSGGHVDLLGLSELDFTLADGILTCGDSGDYTVTLNEDGGIALNIVGIVFYASKAAE